MATARNDTRPMAEPGPHREGTNVGGIASNAEAGLEDALERQAERRDDDETGAATIGEGMSAGGEPRLDLGGKDEPGSAPGSVVPSRQAQRDDARQGDRQGHGAGGVAGEATPRSGPGGVASTAPGDQATEAAAPHPDETPAEPTDEGPLKSLGRAVSEAVIGTLGEDAKRPPEDRKR